MAPDASEVAAGGGTMAVGTEDWAAGGIGTEGAAGTDAAGTDAAGTEGAADS